MGTRVMRANRSPTAYSVGAFHPHFFCDWPGTGQPESRYSVHRSTIGPVRSHARTSRPQRATDPVSHSGDEPTNRRFARRRCSSVRPPQKFHSKRMWLTRTCPGSAAVGFYWVAKRACRRIRQRSGATTRPTGSRYRGTDRWDHWLLLFQGDRSLRFRSVSIARRQLSTLIRPMGRCRHHANDVRKFNVIA